MLHVTKKPIPTKMCFFTIKMLGCNTFYYFTLCSFPHPPHDFFHVTKIQVFSIISDSLHIVLDEVLNFGIALPASTVNVNIQSYDLVLGQNILCLLSKRMKKLDNCYWKLEVLTLYI